MYRILIVGAGYVGSRLASHFRSKNQKVWGVTRTSRRRAELEAMGATPLLADLARPETLEAIPPAHFIVISPAPSARDEAHYRALYLTGIGNLLARLKKNPRPHLAVYLSSTGVYRDCGGAWVDETAALEPDTGKGRILLEAEEQVLRSGLPAAVFRLAGIYGPGRNAVERLRKGQWPEEKEDHFLNMIHVEDVVEAMPVLFNKAEAGGVYLGVDDEPVRRSEFAKWLCGKLGMPAPAGEDISRETAAGGKRCRNERLKGLGYSFKYPTFREGYSGLLDANLGES